MTDDTTGLTFAESVVKIQHEHFLIFHRMTWMISSQAFLFATYFFLRYSTVIQKPGDVSFILYIISFVGIVSTLVFYTSVLAAFKAIGNWRRACGEPKKDKLTSPFLLHFLGDAPPAITGPMIIAVWVSIIRSDWRFTKDLGEYNILAPFIVLGVATSVWFIIAFFMFKDR